MLPLRQVSWAKPALASMQSLFDAVFTRWVPVGRSGAMAVEPFIEPHRSSLSKKAWVHRKIKNRMARESRRRNRQ